jgi:hypothetical protein
MNSAFHLARVKKRCLIISQQHAPAGRRLLQRVENDATFLPSITTGEEAWVYGYDRTNVVT